ncbi:MAG: hypothetical protein ABJD57_05575, partial [Roseibium sp.]
MIQLIETLTKTAADLKAACLPDDADTVAAIARRIRFTAHYPAPQTFTVEVANEMHGYQSGPETFHVVDFTEAGAHETAINLFRDPLATATTTAIEPAIHPAI